MSIESVPQQAIDNVVVGAYQHLFQARALPMLSESVQVWSAHRWEIGTEKAVFRISSHGGREDGRDPLSYSDLHVKDRQTGRSVGLQMLTDGPGSENVKLFTEPPVFPKDILTTEEVFGLAGVNNADSLSYYLRNHLSGAQVATTERGLTLVTREQDGMLKVREECTSKLGILTTRSTLEHQPIGNRSPFSLLASVHSGNAAPAAIVEQYKANDGQGHPEALTQQRLEVVRDHLAIAITDLRGYHENFKQAYPSSPWNSWPALQDQSTTQF